MTSIAALLLLLSGPNASADEEPAARAVLPPPLRSVPAEDRQIPEPSPGINQSSPLPSAMKLDGSNTAVSQGKPHRRSTPSGGVAVAKQQNAPARPSSRFTDANARRQSERRVASRGRQGHGPSIGQLSPPSDIRPRADSAPTATEPPKGPRLYYPGYSAGPPAYGYVPRYPYSWEPPGPGVFR